MLDLISKKKTWDGILWKLLSLNLFPFLLFSTKKKYFFFPFGFKLEKLWFFPFRTMARRNVWANGWIGRGHFPPFDGSIGDLLKKKKKSSKNKLFKFLSFGFKLEKLWFFPFRAMARRNVWANVRIGRGHFPLFDESIGGLSKKKERALRLHQLRSLTKVDLRKALSKVWRQLDCSR